jgi:hypothetical protein
VVSTVQRPILKNQAIAQSKQVETGTDLSHLITKRDVLMQVHGFDWQHPRMLAYLQRCNAPSRHHLTEKQLKNLVEKLEAL